MTDKSVTKFYEIKWMVPEDAAENVAHLNKAGGETNFCSFDENGYYRSETEERQMITEVLSKKLGVLLIARDLRSNEIVGSGTCISKGRRSRHVFELGIAVLKNNWRQGIGKEMMFMLIEESRKLGAKKIILDFNESNIAALKLYEKLGFVEEGRLRNQIIVNGQYLDLIIMALSL